MIAKHTQSYTVKKGDTVSRLIAKRFGGRYGNRTYSQGLKLFKAANPHIKDVNRIYAGQKVYMPDPSIREQSWYNALFDEAGSLVEKEADKAETESASPPPQPAVAAAPEVSGPPSETGTTGPAAEAASVIGGRLLDKGTYFFPMKQGSDFELDLSRSPSSTSRTGPR
jgi:LysM repeat protein